MPCNTVPASAHGVQRFAEAVWPRDSDTRVRSSNVPFTDSGMDTNSIVTNEQCEQRIQSVPKELVWHDRWKYNTLISNDSEMKILKKSE